MDFVFAWSGNHRYLYVQTLSFPTRRSSDLIIRLPGDPFMSATRIGILGIGGRMGFAMARAVATTEGAALGGGTERPGSPHLGQDPGLLIGSGPTGLKVTDEIGRAHV